MADLTTWLAVIVAIFALHAIPVITVPTWAVLAWVHINLDAEILPLALAGALAATGGRWVLALGSRRLGPRVLPARWRRNLDGFVGLVRRNRTMSLTTLGLVTSGAIPSEQLFIAAGIARVPLAPLLAAFAVGRLAGYVLWISTARVATDTLESLLAPQLGGTVAIVVQLGAFALLIAMMQVDWSALATRVRGDRQPVEPPA
jgi:hypothetical protein